MKYLPKLTAIAAALIALLFTTSRATQVHVNPGADRFNGPLQTTLNNASGDSLYMRPGTYTFTGGTSGMTFTSGWTGVVFTNLWVGASVPGTVILDGSGITGSSHLFYGGDASGVTIADVTITDDLETTTNENWTVVRDNADTAMNNWKFYNIVVDRTAHNTAGQPVTSFFGRTNNAIGTGITFNNITTTANYDGIYLIDALGTNANRDLLIQNVDARLHAQEGTTPNRFWTAIRLVNVWDARITNVQIYKPYAQGIQILSSATGGSNGVFDVEVTNVDVDGGGTATQPAIHVGNPSEGAGSPPTPWVCERVRLHNVTCRNMASYGFEFENGPKHCELVNFRTFNTAVEGVALAEDTDDIAVLNGVIDGVTGGWGITLAYHGRRNRIENNLISNCSTAAFRLAEPGTYTYPTERNTVKNNTIYNCTRIYEITTTNAMPEDATANSLGPNRYTTPTTAYANVVGASKTQAQFEAQFPLNIDAPDVLIQFPGNKSPQEALNLLVNPITGGSKSVQECLNILCGRQAVSIQNAFNWLLGTP